MHPGFHTRQHPEPSAVIPATTSELVNYRQLERVPPDHDRDEALMSVDER